MRMKQIKKSLSFIFCMMLIVAAASITNGCNDKQPKTSAVQSSESSGVKEESKDGEQAEQVKGGETKEEITALGQGETKFFFTVVDQNKSETRFEISTDKEMVGEALLELGLIEGETGEFGLYVKKVNGIVADYETDGTYWAFYVNDEYAMSGVDTTKIEEGTTYCFKVEK